MLIESETLASNSTNPSRNDRDIFQWMCDVTANNHLTRSEEVAAQRSGEGTSHVNSDGTDAKSIDDCLKKVHKFKVVLYQG